MWGRVLAAAATGVSATLPSLRGRASTLPALPLTLTSGRLARLAPSSAVLTASETTILATISHSPPSSSPPSFTPLLVDFRVKAAAVGVIPGTWARRELQPAIQETLVARLIDRALRPALAPPGAALPPTQLTVSVLSSVKAPQAPVDALAVNAAAAAVAASAVEWAGPVAAARVALVDGVPVPFPPESMLHRATLSVFVAANATGNLLSMTVQSLRGAVPQEAVMETVQAAVSTAQTLAELQTEFREKVRHMREREGHSAFPRQMPRPARRTENFYEPLAKADADKVYEVASRVYRDAFLECRQFPGKAHRAAVLTEAQQSIVDHFPDLTLEPVLEEARRASRETYREVLLRDKLRMDGRRFDELRTIRCETRVLPGDVHGSALFERGDTQVLACSTVGLKSQAMRTEEYVVGGGEWKSFFVHYSFPPYSTGEYGRFAGSSSRREVGHSMLAEQALRPLLNFSCDTKANEQLLSSTNNKSREEDEENSYPYSHRLSAEVLASDGSSSMATVCAGSMALMDSGAPLEDAVAGVAMGVVRGPNFAVGDASDYTVLTDILGSEDHFGDMDMKVTGTRSGVTACQLDVKPHDGLPVDVVQNALRNASLALSKILDEMGAVCPVEPRSFPENAPRAFEVPVDMSVAVKTLMKDRALGLKRIEDKSGARLFLDGKKQVFRIEAPNKSACDAAQSLIRDALGNLDIGTKMTATVDEIKPSYAVVRTTSGSACGILHVSKMQVNPASGLASAGVKEDGADPKSEQISLAKLRYPDVRTLLSRGDVLEVVVLESDRARSVLRFGLVSKLKTTHADLIKSEIDAVLAASVSAKAAS
ncbi:unnamed protein product [Chondrus crispus]|uniref:Exoribonuclease phosphorolytic domain-containing protein n=1 Tax=Chondrus crispus TaxID=2769 RepID=R7Q2V0_CHOCR|nr:unnamed protein product [Chondrus crispus]CDF32218.1 unnamed protein product [Chondrus crispus]|eukprot:XP_005711883.1 unnamed protein product [Chondrus crispus]